MKLTLLAPKSVSIVTCQVETWETTDRVLIGGRSELVFNLSDGLVARITMTADDHDSLGHCLADATGSKGWPDKEAKP